MTADTRSRVALVMIARDEARHIQRALHSALPHVDDCLVLDTGSVDDTPRLAREAGARVAHCPWVNDFSAARNAALALANADWHLVLDADEWLESGGDVLSALRTQAPTFVGRLRVDSLQDASGSGGLSRAPSWLPRVLPGWVRYQGRVHEQPQHQLPVQDLPVVIAHDGYLSDALAAKAGRNAALLAREVAEHPQDPYAWYQLGKDHDVYERYEQALHCFEQALQHGAGRAPAAWRHDLCVRQLHALKCCGRHAEAVELGQAALQQWPRSPDVPFALGDVLLDLAARQAEHADGLLPLIEQSWQHCLSLGEHPGLEGAVAGRGSHLAARNLAHFYELFGRPAEAAELRRRYALADPPAA